MYIFIMIFSCIVDYIHALIIDKNRGTFKAKLALISSIFINLSLLVFFKYSDFIISILNNSLNTNIPLLQITLPIGISFYTFQTMSYTIDVYRNNAQVQKNIISLGTFVTLFPQLVAGPIVRYSDISKDLNHRTHNVDKVYEGIYRFIIGLSKKIILANNLGIIWISIKTTPFNSLSNLTAWLGIICFTLQIYFDFSGYSDMAIGLGKIFGFEFLENFNYPYISQSASEFWRRWHISLGSWFRDYVYFPLGGSRRGNVRTYINLFIVWFLTGFWHGASWTFIAWGLYFGLLIGMEKSYLGKLLNKVPRFVRHIYLLLVVMIGWVFFRADSFSYSIEFIKNMFFMGTNVIFDGVAASYINDYWFVLVLSMIFCMPIVDWFRRKIEVANDKILESNISYVLNSVVYTGILLIVIFKLVNSTYNPFLYFRF